MSNVKFKAAQKVHLAAVKVAVEEAGAGWAMLGGSVKTALVLAQIAMRLSAQDSVSAAMAARFIHAIDLELCLER